MDEPSRPRRRLAWFGAGAVVSLALAFLLLRNTDPPLTRETLDAAKRTWAAKGPKSYAMEIDVDGTLHAVRVLEGRVVEMTLDGRPATARDHWTVEGMFGFLGTELDNAAQPERAYGIKDPGSVVLTARFDPDLGLPRRFFRHVIGRQTSTEWEIRKFEPAP